MARDLPHLLFRADEPPFRLDGVDQLAEALIEATMGVRPALRRAIHAANQTGRTLYESVGVTLGVYVARRRRW